MTTLLFLLLISLPLVLALLVIVPLGIWAWLHREEGDISITTEKEITQ